MWPNGWKPPPTPWARHPNPQLEQEVDGVIALLEEAPARGRVPQFLFHGEGA